MNSTVNVQIAQVLPEDWHTASVTGRDHTVPIYFSEFSSIVQNFTLGEDILVNSTGCLGTCNITVLGAGFAVDCATNFETSTLR